MSRHPQTAADRRSSGSKWRDHGDAGPAGKRSAGLVGVLLASIAHLTAPATAAERRVIVGHEGRVPLDATALPRYAATGIVECGGVRGIGQVTGAGDVVSSAAHVFFDEQGRSRATRGACVFVVETGDGRQRVPLIPDGQLCGSTSPYATAGRHDWAMARLARPIPGVRPYEIGGLVATGDPIAVVAWESGVETVQICRVRDVVTGDGGARELRTDCTGFDGMSGAAYLTVGRRPRIVGVHVGFRSVDPDRTADYSDHHYTFGTAVGGVFRRALAAVQSTGQASD